MPTIPLRLELHKPTQEKQRMYQQMTERNTDFANGLLLHPGGEIAKRNQRAQTFRKLWCSFNNQNLKVEKGPEYYTVSFPTLEKRVGVPVVTEIVQQHRLEKLRDGCVKQGATKLYSKKKKGFLALALPWEATPTGNERVMGIDLGLRYVAVARVGTKPLFFPGSPVAYKRRPFSSRRKKVGKAKKLRAIRKSKNKEARWMRDPNHPIRRPIVDRAIAHGVGVIRMEDWTEIRNRAKSKRQDPGRNLHSGSFYQLREFIRYKAEIAGIRLERVNPEYTSQMCRCGHREKANRQGIHFRCKPCRYRCHADLNGAIHIAKAISGLAA